MKLAAISSVLSIALKDSSLFSQQCGNQHKKNSNSKRDAKSYLEN